MHKSHSPFGGKISPDWAARLSRIPRENNVRAVVMLAAAGQTFEQSLAAVDRVIGKFGGRRLADAPDRFRALPVETTPEGLIALSRRAEVQAVLEDRAVAPLQPLR